MSGEIVHRIHERVVQSGLDAAWSQWSALTAMAVPVERAPVWSIVDPEALVLASLAFIEQERRLGDIVAAWASRAAPFMSLQRMRTLGSSYPTSVQRRLGIFGRAALAGGDPRWKKLVSKSSEDGYVPRGKPLGPLSLRWGPSLTLRLRAGFGVNVKADLLSLLLGWESGAVDLRVIAAATAYTERAVRNAAAAMSMAGFIREIHGRPSSFRAEQRDGWAQVLQTQRPDRPHEQPDIPPWRFWSAVFLFLVDVAEWGQQAELGKVSAYVASSRARDLYQTHAVRLRQAGLDLPAGDVATGAEYLAIFEDIVQRVATWISLSL